MNFAALFAQSDTRTFYQASRLGVLDQWWHWLMVFAAILAVLLFVSSVYRRDGVDLKKPTRWALLLLRTAAFVGVLLFFLKIEKRTEQKLVKNSRAVVLVDTSQSMGLSDRSAAAKETTRIEQVAETINGGLLEELQQKHDVVVYGFDQTDRPVELASLPKLSLANPDSDPTEANAVFESQRRWSRVMFVITIICGVLAAIAILAHLLLGYIVRNEEGESWALLVAISCLIVAAVFYSVANLRYPEIGWAQAFRGAALATSDPTPLDNADSSTTATVNVDWDSQLRPRGIETRLGDALQFVVEKEQGGPIAGITVFTDGNANAGIDFRAAIGAAQQAEIPVHLVGVGSAKRPANVRVVDVEAPARVYPGDMFTIRGFVQSYGMIGKGITARLASQKITGPNDTAETIPIDEQIISAGQDGEVTTVEFQVTPDDLGRRKYIVEISGPADDLDEADNRKSQQVEIVDRKNKVLLLAGGPTREYRFLRTMLFRDRDTTVDVILQSSPNGASQESDRVLRDFPTTAEDLFDYDCIVAFDPDWSRFELPQVELLDRWVAEKAGGLILVAGPVHTPEWTTLRRGGRATDILKGLYPVTFFSRSATRLARGNVATDAFPIQMTPTGAQSRFLWLDDTANRSLAAWQTFPGVFSVYPVRGLKPVASLLANADKPTNRSDQPSVFLAEQFYGAGRVLYLGSGELWRLRIEDPNYFDQLYTKMVRHVSQGRLLRDSSRGVLMVGKDRCVLGETITVRASLTDSQFRPLQVDSVEADLLTPDGIRKPIKLNLVKDAPRDGTFAGQFSATREGDYRIELIVPESDDFDMLTSAVKVRVPELEIESPQRNDSVMNEIASATGGTYFAGIGSLASNTASLANQLIPQDQETYLPGTPDRKFQQRLMGWLMALICGVLSLEWLIRRLHRLA